MQEKFPLGTFMTKFARKRIRLSHLASCWFVIFLHFLLQYSEKFQNDSKAATKYAVTVMNYAALVSNIVLVYFWFALNTLTDKIEKTKVFVKFRCTARSFDIMLARSDERRVKSKRDFF